MKRVNFLASSDSRVWQRAGILAALAVVIAAPAAWAQSDQRAVFVANNGNLEGSVTAFALNPDGTLTFVNRVITGTRPNLTVPCPGCNPYDISLSPNGRYLATGHASGDNVPEQITIFEVMPDGSITQILPASVPGTPMDVVWITDEYLAATRTDPSPNKVVVYRFDPAGPSLTEVDIKDVGTFSTYLAVHPSRQYLYVNDSGSARLLRAFRVSPEGQLTQIDTEYTGSYYGLELTLTHDGTKLYAAGGITYVELGYHVAEDGTLTPMAGSPFPQAGTSPSNVFCSADDRFLLVGHGTDATLRSLAIDPVTGDLTYTGNVFDVGLQGTLGDVSAIDNLVFVTDNSTAIDGIMGIYSFTLTPTGVFVQNGPITWTLGIAPRSIAVWKPPPQRGDMNCDGSVDFDDIDPFVLALSDPDAYVAAYPYCWWINGDCNDDGDVDFDDIDVFVALLGG